MDTAHEDKKLIAAIFRYRKEKSMKMKNNTGSKLKGGVIRRKYLQMSVKFCTFNTGDLQVNLLVTRL